MNGGGRNGKWFTLSFLLKNTKTKITSVDRIWILDVSYTYIICLSVRHILFSFSTTLPTEHVPR
jgi:hypothetical protein